MPAYGYSADDMRRWDRTGIDPHANAIASGVQLPDYPCTQSVYGFARQKTAGGRTVTVAIALWHRPGFVEPHKVSDLVTLMRLADLLSDKHGLPVNPEKFYGPRGRGCPVGRK